MDHTYTNLTGQSIVFDIVVDDILHNLLDEVNPKNKAILSIVNDFEDGDWRLKKFEQFIWNNMKETALSKSERDSLIDDPDTTLQKSVMNLRLLDGEELGGEIGEILLHGIMKRFYSALPVVPKIFYKQNSNDFAKGADSVHIVLNNDTNFSIWLGEAKFYNSLENNRLDKILDSIHNMFDKDKLRKEFNLITSMKDLELYVKDTTVLKDIKNKLSDGISLDEIKQHLHIPVMLLHECSITANNKEKMDEYKEKIKDEHLDIAKRFVIKLDKKLKDTFDYKEIKFHLILFPVPDKLHIVKRFNKRAKGLKDDDGSL
jgi:hypothetical protein